MSKRSLLYSAAFIGLMAASGIALPAQAQKGMALQPSTQWTVTKVEASSEQNGYCAIARRFRPNTVLTIARNAHNEASFALDFQVPRFRQAEGMEVMLDPGAGQQRGFEVYPVSNQAFVIRLGDDKKFFKALDKTGFLRVEFGGKAYHFDLSDIDTGQAKLATCIGKAVPDDASPEMVEAAPVEDVERDFADGGDTQYDRDVQDLKRQLAKLKSDNERMNGKDYSDTDSSGSVVIEQLSQQITALEQENQDLKSRLQNGSGTDSLRSKKDIASIDRLTRENGELRAALDNGGGDDIQEAVLNDQIQQLQAENQRLRGMATQTDTSDVKQEDVLSLIQENDTLKAQLAMISSEAGDSDETEELKGRISSLEEENRVLKQGVSTETGSIAESRAQIESLKKENKHLQEVVQAAEVSGDSAVIVKELKGQVDKLSADAEIKDSKLLEMSQLATEVQMLKTTNEELEKQLIEGALRGPVSARTMTQKIAALETQNDSLLQKIQSESDEATSTDAENIDALKAENENLKKTIAESQALKEDNVRLQAEVENLRRDNDDLKAKLAAAPVGGADEAELQKLKDDNETLRTQLQQKEADLAELNSLREEVKRLRAENEDLKKNPQVASANSPIPGGAPNPEVDNLTRENERLRQEIANTDVGAKDSEIADLKAKLAEQESKIAASDEALKKAEDAAKASKDEAAKAAKEAKAAQKKAEEQKAAEATEAKKKEEEMKAAEAASQRSPIPTPPEAGEEIVSATLPDDSKLAEAPAPEAVPAGEPKSDKVAIKAEPFATPAIEDEMIRLERQLSEAKASGDQMAIQQAARDYMALKSRLSASQELATSTAPKKGNDQAKDLLAFSGTGKAPVGDVEQADTMAAPEGDPQSEALLNAGKESQPTSAMDEMPEPRNEAQGQEQAMKRSPAPMPPAADEENMKVSASEDPYADMKVEDEFKGYESVAGGSVKEQGDAGLHPPGEVKLPEAPSQDAYRSRINDSRMVTPESVQQSYEQSAELMDGKPAEAKADWAQAQPADVTSASQGGIYHPAVAVPQLLASAQVVTPQSVTVVPNASGTDKVSYQWKADKVYGSAVQQPLSDPSRFNNAVQAYLDQTKKRCGEDFAVVPDGDQQAGDTKIATYEIACVGKGVSSSASLIFFSKQGTFTVLAHEAPAEQLESAMDIKERLLKAIAGS